MALTIYLALLSGLVYVTSEYLKILRPVLFGQLPLQITRKVDFKIHTVGLCSSLCISFQTKPFEH